RNDRSPVRARNSLIPDSPGVAAPFRARSPAHPSVHPAAWCPPAARSPASATDSVPRRPGHSVTAGVPVGLGVGWSVVAGGVVGGAVPPGSGEVAGGAELPVGVALVGVPVGRWLGRGPGLAGAPAAGRVLPAVRYPSVVPAVGPDRAGWPAGCGAVVAGAVG